MLPVDVRPRREPGEELTDVLDRPRAVDVVQALRLAVAAGVRRQHRVAVRNEAGLGCDVGRGPRLAETVQRDDRRPPARGRRAVGTVERRRELDAVRHRQPQVIFRERLRRRREHERRDCGGEEATHAGTIQSRPMDSRPVGVFDSGVGGLTVLHECLVTMPHEDFVYLGDHARLPYGPRPLDEIRRFAREIASFLERQRVKLILVACNAATSAALPQLQEELTVPIVGVITPEAHAAVQATRNRLIGLLATQATVDAGRYRELVQALDAGARLFPVACPRLVPLIESDTPFGAETSDAVREYAEPLKAAGVDTVILGCTHYPLIRPIFQRVFGRGVTLVFSAEETAREVAETLARKGIEHAEGREGESRFLTTGDPELFRRARRALPAAAARRRRGRDRRGARGHCGMTRTDGRRPDQLRPVTIEPDFLARPHGSALVSIGGTRVLCTATLDEGVPRWLSGKGKGWLTAEYSMLPASTGDRTPREASQGRQKGRTVEIQRLIGRVLRAVADMEALGERTLWLDCDVLEADGGTRCAAISGVYVAAYRALDRHGLSRVLFDSVAAVSAGIVGGEALVDLDYSEDSTAEVDLNVAMTGDGRFVEVQSTAERGAFDRDQLDRLLELSAAAIEEIGELQRQALGA